MRGLAYRPAQAADTAAIVALLERNALPTADLSEARPEFIVACDATVIIGAGAVERCGASGLLRSLAVEEQWRGAGVGRALLARLERRARELALGELVLLTQTARDFFARQGYRVIARDAAPAAVRGSAEFAALCPQSAVCMLKQLN